MSQKWRFVLGPGRDQRQRKARAIAVSRVARQMAVALDEIRVEWLKVSRSYRRLMVRTASRALKRTDWTR
jgi:hypothetical protein